MLIMSRRWTNVRRYNKQYFKDFKDKTAVGLKSNTFKDKPSSLSESEAQKASPSITMRLSYTVKRIIYKYRFGTGIGIFGCRVRFGLPKNQSSLLLHLYRILCYNEKLLTSNETKVVVTALMFQKFMNFTITFNIIT